MGMPESFSRLCHSYLNLADRFQQLDVECMEFKARLVPLLHNLKAKDNKINDLTETNQRLTEQLEALGAKYDQLKPLEAVMADDMQDLLKQAEEQANLVDETLAEMDSDSMPELAPQDKEILEQFYNHPEQFAPPDINHGENNQSENGYHAVPQSIATASGFDSAPIAETA
ncbi:MAG: hypothetical protein WBA10_15335 [Elainellaceae cyanobacterium]